MIPLFIDTSNVANSFSFTEQEVEDFSAFVIDRIALAFDDAWNKEIDNSLHQTKEEYRSGIFSERIAPNILEVGLDDKNSKLSLMIEKGASSFEMQQGFSKSSKRKFKADGGWYLTIPFRYATSTAIGESSIFSGKLPEKIELVAKQVNRPLQMDDLPSEFQNKGVRSEMSVNGEIRKAYEHKAPIYQGVNRNTKKDSHHQYNSFRRVSDKSDKDAWLHPGFTAYNLMDKALNSMNIGTVVGLAKDEYLDNR